MSSSLIYSTKKSLLELIWPKKYDWFEEVSINVDLREKSASGKFDAVFYVFLAKDSGFRFLVLMFPPLELVSKFNAMLLVGRDLDAS